MKNVISKMVFGDAKDEMSDYEKCSKNSSYYQTTPMHMMMDENIDSSKNFNAVSHK